jgi:toxin ParE1/3/4
MNTIRRPLFLADVEEAADYLFTEAGENVALHWQDALKRTLSLLRDFPEIGRLRLDLPVKDIRAFPLKGFPNWLIFYRINENQIELLRVKHGMMHLPGLFEVEQPS